MSDELKVQIPSGYRWVKAGEIVSELYEQAEGRWVRSAGGIPPCNWHYITPIELPKPETVDVPIVTNVYQWLEAKNPNNDFPYTLCHAPCIVGPDWAFAGFVWEIGSVNLQYVDVVDGKIIYAKAVRFLRVQGGVK